MEPKFFDRGLRLAVASLLMTVAYTIPQAQGYTPRETQEGQPVLTAAGRPAYNIIFVISDQRAYRVFAGEDYSKRFFGRWSVERAERLVVADVQKQHTRRRSTQPSLSSEATLRSD